MDVAAWLKNLGLGQYETAFRDNGIGEAVLPHLTVEDLKEIGVATVGDRRKLLAAIAELASPTSSRRDSAPALTRSTLRESLELSAERRPITVLFCDLVGSTTISAALDAEDWRNLVNAYLDAASEAVTQMGGHVAKKLGDGLMALFGHPVAQENEFRTRGPRGARDPARAGFGLNARSAASGAPSLPPASELKPGRSGWIRPVKSSATRPISPRGCKRWPSRERSWSQRAFSIRSQGYSSPRIAARIRLRARPSRRRSTGSCARAAPAAVQAKER